MLKNVTYLIFGATLLLCVCMSDADAFKLEISKLNSKDLFLKKIPIVGDLVTSYGIVDRDGEHILVLTQKIGTSHIKENLARDERIDLFAAYYKKTAKNWVQEWTLKDFTDCPGLDSGGGFFADFVTVTDLDNNGIAEITLPYKLSCGGGIDPSTLKIIMRQGREKFAMRGETRVETPGNEAFGGGAVYDNALLLPTNVVFKKHIDVVRKKVYIEKY